MKQFLHIFAALAVVLTTLSGCKEEVDISKMDTSATVDLALAMPIGTMYATLGDFLGIEQIKPYIEVDHDGVLHLIHDTIIARNFKKIKIEDYPADTIKKCNVKQGFKVDEMWPGDQYIAEYPIEVTFSDVNDKVPSDYDYERFDSVSVRKASYTSRVRISDDLKSQGFKWSWIKRVDILLGDAFNRKGGNVLTVYDRSRDNVNGFDEPITIEIEDFMLYFIKDKKSQAGPLNVRRTGDMTIKYYVSVPWDLGHNITIDDDATIFYDLHLQMLDFDAIWGFCKPSSDMRDESHLVIEESWPMWKDIKKATLPLAEPQVDMDIHSKVGGRFRLNADYFYTLADANPTDTVFAYFDKERTKRKFIEDWTEYGIDAINIDKKTIGDSIVRHLMFNNEIKRGQLDRLVAIRPDRVGYKFYVEVWERDFDKPEYPQIRLAPSNHFNVDAHIDLPLVFNEGLALQYSDTIRDLNLSSISLDSMLNGALSKQNVQDANLVLYLDIKNRIPLGLSANVRFVDADGKDVLVNGKPIQLFKYGESTEAARIDSLNLRMPDVEEFKRTSKPSAYAAKQDQPSEQYIIDIDRDNFDAFSKVKNVVFSLLLHNDSKAAKYPVAITDESSLVIKAGVTARINGKVDIKKILEDNKK